MSSGSAMMSKTNFQFASSIKLEEDSSPKVVLLSTTTSTTTEKQGIVSILGSDCEEITKKSAASSLRRTLSADMSSKKWLAQNGFNFSPMKRIASSEELLLPAADSINHSSSSSSSSFSSSSSQDDVWRSIHEESQTKVDDGIKWSWGSILFEKKNENLSKLPPPYIPPLVRRSGSSLSEKSLEICTESLGSETGSEGFSSYPASEAGDMEDSEKETEPSQQQMQTQQSSESYEDFGVVKQSYSYSKKSGPRSFPPPLPSLAREDGASVHMQSHRQNGRLVLEAVSVPSQNFFQTHREHGRLRLSIVDNPTSEEEIGDEVEDLEQLFHNFEEIDQNDEIEEEEGEEEEEDIEEEEYYTSDENFQKGGLMHVHNPPTIMVKKLMGLDKKNLAWSLRFNKGVNLLEVDDEEEEIVGEDRHSNPPPLPQSLPPPQRVTRLISNPPSATVAAASFNAYEYFWREKKPTMANIIKPIHKKDQCSPNLQKKQVILTSNLKGYEPQKNVVVMRGNKAEYLVPFLSRCNESRRSLLLWEPYCIAT